MKFCICFFCVFSSALLGDALPSSKVGFIAVEEKGNPLFQNEVESLEKLIEINEKRLEVQKQLREKMKLFQKQKEEFVLGNQSQSHAFSMVSNARFILGQLKNEHLSYLFSSEYLEELVFFSSIAGKSSPVRP